jgi:hypothetical protein
LRSSLPIASCLAIICSATTARAQNANPAALTAISDRAPKRAGLPDLVAGAPSDAPFVLYAPSLGRAIEQTQIVLEVLAAVDPKLGRPLGALLTDAIWGSSYQLPAIAGVRPIEPSTALTPGGLREAGIDAAAPVVLIPNVRAEVTVIRFGLSDRRAFEAWLDRIGGRERKRIPVGAETASVLALDSERPIICLARHKQAICQLGVSQGPNVIADLARVVAEGGSTYSRLPGVITAHDRLPRDSVLYAFANPSPLARDAALLQAERERRRTRFADVRTRAASEEESRRMTARLVKWSRWIDGVAAAVLTGERTGVRVELTASSMGKRLLAAALPERRTDDLIGRWAETPALFSALVHADPTFVQRAAEQFGLDLPKDALSGTVALLGLGLDSECPSAKQGAVAELDWAFLIPSALNVGIATTEAAERLHQLLSLRFPIVPIKPPWLEHARPPFAGIAQGSPYEIHVLDRMLIVGTGIGSGAAALRRLASIQPTAKPSARAPFIRASLHPRAIDAAFAAGAFGREHRRELLAIESLRLQLKPLMERIDSIELLANASEDREHVSLNVRIR